MFFSELLSKIHLIIFRKGFVLPLWEEILLEGIKYSLAGFFIWRIFLKIPIESIEGFISSWPVESMTVGLIILILFAGATGIAGITGHWKNSISDRSCRHYIMTQEMVDMDKVNIDKIDMSKMARQSRESADSAEESKNQP